MNDNNNNNNKYWVNESVAGVIGSSWSMHMLAPGEADIEATSNDVTVKSQLLSTVQSEYGELEGKFQPQLYTKALFRAELEKLTPLYLGSGKQKIGWQERVV